MSRRTLTPAARGVVLAVRAALRAGRVDLADQADGSTLATSTAPDGTVLLRAVLRLPVPGADPRQLTLPAVAAVPAPAEVPPAPVAVPAVDDEPARINGLAVGDQITLDDELVEVMGLDDEGWTWRTVDTDPRTRDEGECLWNEVERVAPTRWRVRPVRGETPAQQREEAKAAKPKRAKALKAAAAAAGDEPDPPEPNVSVLDAQHGLAVGDIATLDDEDFRVTVADEFGWQGVTVATTPQGRPLANVHCDWNDVERVGPRAWRTRPTRGKTRADLAEGAPASKGAAKAPKRARPTKATPARLVPVPEADALARYGERSIVAQLHEGDAWGLVWSDELPGHMSYDVAVSATTSQAHRARVYNRGKHCVRDSRDGAEVSRG